MQKQHRVESENFLYRLKNKGEQKMKKEKLLNEIKKQWNLTEQQIYEIVSEKSTKHFTTSIAKKYFEKLLETATTFNEIQDYILTNAINSLYFVEFLQSIETIDILDNDEQQTISTLIHNDYNYNEAFELKDDCYLHLDCLSMTDVARKIIVNNNHDNKMIFMGIDLTCYLNFEKLGQLFNDIGCYMPLLFTDGYLEVC